jgi:TPR repeat protein
LASFSPEPLLPSRSLSDRLALENISATMRNAEPVPVPDQGTNLLAEGEKYLYGRGVVTDCRLAVRNFEDAAEAGSAKAMAHLGSMYGSGRCVKFNRVTAYGWFAQAKNADPDNAWLESNMDMLWRNMSPKERAAILK